MRTKLLDELAAQGMHKNLSFFAFTANAKRKNIAAVWSEGCGRNLQTFPYLFYETGNRGAFHLGCFAETI